MIEILLMLLIIGLMQLLFGLGFIIGWTVSGKNPVLRLGQKAAREIDREIDYYAELHRIISDLVDGKD